MKIISIATVLGTALCSSSGGRASPLPMTEHPIPRLVQHDGRYALLVDGAPYLVLGAQSNNSSDWPATLPEVWSAIEYLHANTLETPIYWAAFRRKAQGRPDRSRASRDAGPRRAREANGEVGQDAILDLAIFVTRESPDFTLTS